MENTKNEMELMQKKMEELIQFNALLIDKIDSVLEEMDYLNRNFNGTYSNDY